MRPDLNLEKYIGAFIEENKGKLFNELNYEITECEIISAIRQLKNKKAAGIDGILNEMLKASAIKIIKPLCKLFNVIFKSGFFPKNWRINTLTPLFKKGDPTSTDNYRGIAVSGNLSKLFLSILHRRLLNFATDHNLVPACQIGYKKNASTSDHILTMKNIIDRYIKRASRKYLYVCFVDFKKAFDTVWRKAMLFKLLKMGVDGNFFSILENMYSDVLYSVKLNGRLSEYISSNVGVKQGCVMSPLLFNLFLADLPDVFDKHCDPVSINDVTKLSCLMFADDLVLFSESESGLQRCLNQLQVYCDKWKLTINVNKTKVIIFNAGGHKISKFEFKIGSNAIEITQRYCYLGIEFSSSGSFKHACDILQEKAMKAFFKLKQINPRNNALLTIKLFDALVTPIATYASQVWGLTFTEKIETTDFKSLCDNAPVEKINIKLCKYILGVNKYSVNIAVKGELGRFPLMINIINQSLKYSERVFSLDNSSIVKLSCADSGVYSWSHQIQAIKSKFHCPAKLNMMRNEYRYQWLKHLRSESESGRNGKLRTYSKFKSQFTMENYIIQFPLPLRRNFTKLRISAHRLAIETGRHTKPKTPIEQRLCVECNNIEDEWHCLFVCHKYDTERKLLYDSLNSISSIDLSAPSDNLFKLLMSGNNGDIEFYKAMCIFTNECFKNNPHDGLVS